jgi:nitroreductase
MYPNPVVESLFMRKSVRAFAQTPVSEEHKNLIIDAGIQAPSAGNQQLYTILDIEYAEIKERLAVLCDNQPFIAKAPVVLVFLADCARWQECYRHAGIAARSPGPGDLMLACEDALIAAQNMVVAAESLGIGSCYIGDILENREAVTDLLCLAPHVFPITLLVFGYPTEEQAKRKKPPRPDRAYLVQKNRYAPPSEQMLRAMHGSLHPDEDFDSFMSAFCKRKYMSDFSREMNRSTREYLREFRQDFPL